MKLFPRVSDTYARLLANSYSTLMPEQARQVSSASSNSNLANTLFAPTGGTRIDAGSLEVYSKRIENIAAEYGYPEVLSSETQRRFDFELLKFLATLPLYPAEGSRGDTWQYFSCVALPHIVIWRHGRSGQPVALERFIGGNRNAFQRLFIRARLFASPVSESPWRYLDPSSPEWLSEDQQVAITERTTIARSQALCLAMAQAFHASANFVPQSIPSPKQTLFREAMKFITRELAFVRLSGLKNNEIVLMAERAFQNAVKGLGGDDSLLEESQVESETTILPRVLDRLSPELAIHFEELFNETQSTDLDSLFPMLQSNMEWLERKARLQKSIQIGIAESLATALTELHNLARTHDSNNLRRIVATALHYFVSQDDTISYEQENGFEDDRDIVNAVALALGRSDLEVPWLDDTTTLNLPPQLRGRFLKLMGRVTNKANLGEELRNHRSFLLSASSDLVDPEQVQMLTHGYLRLVGALEEFSDIQQLVIRGGIAYFVESDDVFSDFGRDGLVDDIQVHNAVVDYLEMSDLQIPLNQIRKQKHRMKLVKRLSANDVGETGSHQFGVHLPKLPQILELLPSDEKNPEVLLKVRGPESVYWDIRIVYYNNKFFGGTRDELRLTRLTPFIRHFGLGAGDGIVLSQDDEWSIQFLRSEDLANDITESWKVIEEVEGTV